MPINLSGDVTKIATAATAYNTKQLATQTNPNEAAKQKATQSYWAEAWKKRNQQNSPYQVYLDNVEAYTMNHKMSREDAIKKARADWESTMQSSIKKNMAEQGAGINNINDFIAKAREAELAGVHDEINQVAHNQKKKDTYLGSLQKYFDKDGGKE